MLLVLLTLSACSGESYSLLMQAARFGDVPGVGKYAAEGFDVNEKSKQGKTALILAAAAGHAKVVEALIDLHADVQAQDKNGATALILAATEGHAEAVRVLLKHGADVAAKDHDGGTALLNAVFFGYRDAAAELLKYKQGIDPIDLNEAVLIAAGMGHIDIVKDMLQSQVNVNVVGRHNRTPLMAAVKFGRVDTVRLLVDSGSDATPHDDDDSTALTVAQELGNKEIIELIEKALVPKPVVTPPPAAPDHGEINRN
jgi:ankyrin repeat protein